MELFEPAVKGVKVLDPTSDESEMGPLITAAQRETVALLRGRVRRRLSRQRTRGPRILDGSDRARDQ